ncbi:HNH endonuclease [Clostridium butyricum]|nr:HNH endonuclease [Clostridium butyricum]
MHFLSDNVKKEGRSTEAFSPFDDEPQEGTKPEPPEPPKEEKKPFNWGKLACNVLAGLAVVAAVTVAAVAVAATAGLAGPVIGAIAIGGAVSGTAAVASMAVSDIARGEVSDMSAYAFAGAREAFVGALSGAIFGPLGAAETLGGKMAVGAVTNGFESIVRQKLNGQDIDWGTVALDGGIGGLTAGAFHYGGKAVDSASPYVKKAFNKVSSKLSENAKYARLALENVNSKANKSVVLGSNFGNVSKKVDDFVDEFKNVKNSSSSIDDLTNNAYKGVTQADERLTSLTKEQLKGKPKNSPNPDKWFKKNGTISIDDEGVWTYHDWEGKSVSYPDGYPDFKSAGMVEQEVNIGPFQGYNKDFPRGDELAPNGPISESSTWHHHQDGVTLQEVLTKLHERFRHRGGMSKIKK